MDKKIKKAAALSYEKEDEAPKIAALGKGDIAERIIKTAENNSIPVMENSELVDTLMKLEIGQEIPPELYSIVAEVLVYIAKIDKLEGERK